MSIFQTPLAMRKNLLSIMTLLFLTTGAIAQTISIQGVLRDENKRAMDDGAYEITFKIYDVAEEGTALWSDTYGSLQITNGVFQANLGENNSISTLPFNETYYVGVKVENNKEMSPRIEMTTFPYAMAVRGETNTFPSTGNIIIEDDNLVLLTGNITFPDNTTLNTADLGGEASSLGNPTEVLIHADNDATGEDGIISFQSGGQANMTILDNGNVGVGTTEPVAKMHIDGEGKQTPAIFLEAASKDITYKEGNNLQIGSYNPEDSSYNETIRIDADGDIGFGTTSPKAKLHINSGTTIPALYLSNGTRDITYPVGDILQFGVYDPTDSTFALNFYLNAAGTAVVTDGSSNLTHVDGRGDLYVGDDLEVDGDIYMTGEIIDAHNNYYALNPSNSSTMNSLTITGGSPTIQHANGAADLYVGSDVEVEGSIYINNFLYDRDDITYYINPNVKSRIEELEITDGTSSITYASGAGDLYVDNELEVDGDIYMAGEIIDEHDNDYRLNPSVNSRLNNLFVDDFYMYGSSTSSWYYMEKPALLNTDADWDLSSQTPSDKRLKNEITIIPNALEKIMQLRGVTYRWNEIALDRFLKPSENFHPGPDATEEEVLSLQKHIRDSVALRIDKVNMGLIAQEVAKVAPEVVNLDNDGYYKVEYDKLIGLLVEAIKEQQGIIEAQSVSIKAQADKIGQIESKNNQLKTEVKSLTEKTEKIGDLNARLTSIEKLLQLSTEEGDGLGQNNE